MQNRFGSLEPSGGFLFFYFCNFPKELQLYPQHIRTDLWVGLRRSQAKLAFDSPVLFTCWKRVNKLKLNKVVECHVLKDSLACSKSLVEGCPP
ncbi:hypothetical protein AOLI_G00174050 [Acnodon oligacanthus]